MAVSQSLVEKNRTSYDSVGVSDNENDELRGSILSEDKDYSYRDLSNECSLLLPDGGSSEDSEDDDPEQIQASIQQHLEYRHQNRFLILVLIALTPTGVKFFKAAQSSFQEYLMTDPKLLMSATTYSLSLSLMSFPIATLIGGAMLDYKAKREKQDSRQAQRNTNCFQRFLQKLMPTQPNCLGSSRTPSYSAIFFLALSLLGIIIYGYGLEMMNSIPVGLAGATIFGLSEGCVVVASRTFVAHAFYGSDGAFAQGVLVAMNNLAMMASKISLPWLIENQKKMGFVTSNCFHNISDCYQEEQEIFEYNATIPITEDTLYNTENGEKNIWIGVVACCMVQLFSLAAGILYAWKFGLAPPPQSHSFESPHEKCHRRSSTKKEFLFSGGTSIYSRLIHCFDKLPITFWIVAIGRAIFVVVFKVFTRNSNSFLMEKFGVSPVAAGLKSSFHELFALGSPVVGYLAYRSPGGIVPVLLFAAALGSVSIATLACLPADVIQSYLPGGALTPIIGISIAHGIFIPICMAIIPQTCSPDQTGMAFAVVEVIGSIFNLTNILFGWLRDIMGNYQVAMEMLLGYTLVGMALLWMSRKHIKFEEPIDM